MSDGNKGIVWRNTERGYGAMAKALHWIVALFVITLLIVGFVMVNVLEPYSDLQISMFQWHKVFGFTVLTLVLLRLVWKLFNPAPRMPETMSGFERFCAGISHWGFYLLLIAMPVSGLMMHATWRFRDDVSSWIMQIPFMSQVPMDPDLHDFFVEMHEVVAWLIVGFLTVHVLAALRHHIVKRDDTLRRMMPGSRP